MIPWSSRSASSPRLRGLLPGEDGSARRLHVVPAPAGVARAGADPDPDPPRRPRACGGCSWGDAKPPAPGPSSPRLRGLLRGRARHLEGAGVVPAPAGVAPRRPGRRWCRCGRPRACGGCSQAIGSWTPWAASSPRLRGLLGLREEPPGIPPVVPAPAGVAPNALLSQYVKKGRPRACGSVVTGSTSVSSPRLRGLLLAQPVQSAFFASRPRACGGCSWASLRRRVLRRSSPRLRGLLAGRPVWTPRVCVVPAPAGVAPPCTCSGSRGRSRPRACGGCSWHSSPFSSGSGSSPRLRGLLSGPWWRHGLTTCRPRACGGCSVSVPLWFSDLPSSPRLRGLLLVRHDDVDPGPVVPAPAGVAPSSSTSRPPAARRPRACGGCSAGALGRAVTLLSSPRLRGLLPSRASLTVRGPVVPAPAGVARSRSTPARRSRGRPRACGGCSPPTASTLPTKTSSPRLRGLLGTGTNTLPRVVVVPAPAGVAPTRHNHQTPPDRRPRACGGCSRGG